MARPTSSNGKKHAQQLWERSSEAYNQRISVTVDWEQNAAAQRALAWKSLLQQASWNHFVVSQSQCCVSGKNIRC